MEKQVDYMAETLCEPAERMPDAASSQLSACTGLSKTQGECTDRSRDRSTRSVIGLHGDSIFVSGFQCVCREYVVKLIKRRV